MKIRTSEVPVQSCFLQGRTLRKKVADDRAATRSVSGKVSTKKIKGDPEVELVSCPLGMLGVGMRRHPEAIVQIGDGNPLRRNRKQR